MLRPTVRQRSVRRNVDTGDRPWLRCRERQPSTPIAAQGAGLAHRSAFAPPDLSACARPQHRPPSTRAIRPPAAMSRPRSAGKTLRSAVHVSLDAGLVAGAWWNGFTRRASAGAQGRERWARSPPFRASPAPLAACGVLGCRSRQRSHGLSPVSTLRRTLLWRVGGRSAPAPPRSAREPQLVMPFSSANRITCAVFVISSLLMSRAR